MSLEPKPLSRLKARAIAEWPCDGIPRYVVSGSILAVKVPYSTAYREIFTLAGGTIGDSALPGGKHTRIHTQESIRRITALNRLYVQYGLKVIASQRAAQELLPKPVEQPTPEPCSTVPPST